MGYKCCAPNCKTGDEEYEETKQTGEASGEKAKGKKRKKKIIGETLSVFKFPDSEKESATRTLDCKSATGNWKPGKDGVPANLQIASPGKTLYSGK